MPLTSRQRRGRATQAIYARRAQGDGWPYAEAVQGAVNGRDVRGMPGLAPEVKATGDLPGPRALRQAARNARADLPYVVWRPDGYGEEQVGDWVILLTVEKFHWLLRAAGYGGPGLPPAVAQ